MLFILLCYITFLNLDSYTRDPCYCWILCPGVVSCMVDTNAISFGGVARRALVSCSVVRLLRHKFCWFRKNLKKKPSARKVCVPRFDGFDSAIEGVSCQEWQWANCGSEGSHYFRYLSWIMGYFIQLLQRSRTTKYFKCLMELHLVLKLYWPNGPPISM